MGKSRRIPALLLAVLVLFAMMTCLFTVVLNAGHNCTGEYCPVCEITEICLHTLEVLRDALFAVAVLLVFACCAFSFVLLPAVIPRTGTPISLKVKLLN